MIIQKKITALVLFIVLMLNIAAAGAAQSFPGDVLGTPYENAVNKLTALKIFNYSEDGFHPDREIIRAEFIAVALRLCGFGDEYFSDREILYSRFVDVRTDMWYAPYIEYAAEMGLVQGSGGYFEPDASITYEQAAKIVVSLLGYSYFAENRGGYPTGYNLTASQIGLFKNLKPTSEAIKRGEVAILINNALTADSLDGQSFSQNGETTYEKSKLMQSKLKIYSGRGIVYENNISGTTFESTLTKNDVTIGDNTYHCGETNAYEFLGYLVDFYFSHDDALNEDTLLYVTKSSSVKELIIKAHDIMNVESNYIEYKVSDKIVKATLKSYFDIIYNDKYIIKLSDDLLYPDDGYLKLVANDSGVYDTVFVYDMKNLVVKAVEPYEYRVYDKISTDFNLVLNPNESLEKISIIDALGEKKEFSDIKVGDVLSTFVSQDEKYKKVVISGNKKDTSISATSYEDNEFVIYAGEISYKITEKYLKYLQNSGKSLEIEFQAGEKVNLFLDIDGNIAWSEETLASSLLIAYIVNVGQKEGLDTPVKLKLFTRDGKHEAYECTDRVEIDGDIKKSPEDILQVLKPGGIPRNVLISYKLNSESKINYIDSAYVDPSQKGANESLYSLHQTYTAYYIDDNGKHVRKTVRKDNETLTNTEIQTREHDLKYKTSNKSVGFRIVLSDNIPIFSVPTEKAWEAPENYFSIKGLSTYTNDSQYYFEAYQFDPESFISTALVTYADTEGAKEINVETTMAVVKSVSVAYLNDEVRDKLTVVKDGKEISLIASEEDTFRDLKGVRYTAYTGTETDPEKITDANQKLQLKDSKYIYKKLHPGDVIRYETLPDGSVGTIQLILATAGERTDRTGTVASTVKEFTLNPTISQTTGASAAKYGQTRLVLKNVYRKSDGNMKVADYFDSDGIGLKDITTLTENDSTLEVHKATSYKVMVVDASSGNIAVRAGTADDLLDYKTTTDNYSTILMHVRWGDARGIVVLKDITLHAE